MKIFKDPRKLIRLAAILVLLVVGGIFATRAISGWMTERKNQEAKDLYYSHSEKDEKNSSSLEKEEDDSEDREISSQTSAQESETSRTPEESGKEPETPLDEQGIAVDFHDLLEVNADVVGWITVGEKIDFPVVQGDNDFYLSHDYKKESDANGSIFMNSCNSLDPRDDILLIHGHHMNNGTMFSPLMNYMEYDHLAQNPIVMFRTIYDPQPVYYTPVAAMDVSMFKPSDNYFDVAKVLFEDDESSQEEGRVSSEFQTYLGECAARSVWSPLVDYSVEDQYIMLITCSYNSRNDDRRFCVLCRKLRTEETPETLQRLYTEKIHEKP